MNETNQIAPHHQRAIEKITAKFLSNGWMIYVYHPQYLIAHTARVRDGLGNSRDWDHTTGTVTSRSVGEVAVVVQ